MITELADGVYWVGVVDWDIRHFHGYELSTHRGTTYNAYLIRDEKTVLVDTVWDPFADELLANIRSLVDPADIGVIVANHAEPDHSGALAAVVRHAPNATVVVSKLGMESIPGHYHESWNFRQVGTGDTMNLGARQLTFVEAPMLHWPDSMFTYLSGANILMPNDAFGQHYATCCRFNDEVDTVELYEEAIKYYTNILTPFSAQVGKKIDELMALGIPVDMIAPSHGVVWRDEPMQIVEKYREWAKQDSAARAVILYDTMWQATRRMAEAIGRGLADEGVPYRVMRTSVSDRNDVLVEVFQSRAVIVGSPTLNNGVLPTVAPILEDLRGLRFANKVGAAFGSYGWSGQAVKLMEGKLAECGIPVAADGIRCKWQPTADDLEACRAFGRKLADATKEAAALQG